jgi:hypothetical protein
VRPHLLLPITILFSLAFPDSAFYALAIFTIASLAEEEPVRELLRTAPAVVALLAVRPPPDLSAFILAIGAAFAPLSPAASAVAVAGAAALAVTPESAPFYILAAAMQLLMLYKPADD